MLEDKYIHNFKLSKSRELKKCYI